MNRIKLVGSGNEHDFREVKRRPEEVVLEGVVLAWVQHFQQRGPGIATTVPRDLIDLVEQENRVCRLDFD